MFFVDPPADFSPQFTTVACAIEHAGQLLVIQRAAERSYGGYWGLPAGKQQENETISEAAVREMEEEVGIQLAPSTLTSVLIRPTRYPEFDFWFHMLRVTLDERPSTRLSQREIADFQWLRPAEALTLHYLPNFDDQLRALYPKLLTS